MRYVPSRRRSPNFQLSRPIDSIALTLCYRNCTVCARPFHILLTFTTHLTLNPQPLPSYIGWRNWFLGSILGLLKGLQNSGSGVPSLNTGGLASTLYQERAVFSKMKMDPAKRAQTQNAGEVSSLQRFFSQSVELMTGKVWPYLLLAKYFYNWDFTFMPGTTPSPPPT